MSTVRTNVKFLGGPLATFLTSTHHKLHRFDMGCDMEAKQRPFTHLNMHGDFTFDPT